MRGTEPAGRSQRQREGSAQLPWLPGFPGCLQHRCSLFSQTRFICKGISFGHRVRLPAETLPVSIFSWEKGNIASLTLPHLEGSHHAKKNMQFLKFLLSLPWEWPHLCLHHLFLHRNADPAFQLDSKSHLQYHHVLAVNFLTFQVSSQFTSRLNVILSLLRSVLHAGRNGDQNSYPNCISLFPRAHGTLAQATTTEKPKTPIF